MRISQTNITCHLSLAKILYSAEKCCSNQGLGTRAGLLIDAGTRFVVMTAVKLSLIHIFRQSLYLKLTLLADVDIPLVRDNLTHYAHVFHCNARLPLQGYAMPFLHLVSA